MMIAVGLFAARVARHGVVSTARAGRGLHSRQLRTVEEASVLNQLLNDHVTVIKLNGDLFFGNAQQVCQIRSLLTSISDCFSLCANRLLISLIANTI